jgi:Tfp pilus assembly protein PilN
MQKINLLPKDLAPPGLSEELVSSIRKVAIILGAGVIILVLLGGILRIELARKNKILSKIMTRVKESDLLAENIEDLKRREESLKEELDNIEVYLDRGLIWSNKLIQISNIIPEEVWLTRISFKREKDKKENLNIQGALVPLADTPAINVLSAFMNKLKEDEEFFSDFEDLLIREIRTSTKKSIDIMEFELQLVLK